MSETTQHPQPEIVTPRLRLRRRRPRDAGLVALYCSDRRVAWTTASIPHPYPPGAADGFIERVLAPGSGELSWALDTGADDENGLVGLIGLKPADEAAAEIGYWVAPAFWNTGYASEAVEGVVGYAARTGWLELSAFVFQDNPASARVLTRAGFVYEGEGDVFSLARGAMVPSFRYRRSLGPEDAR
jgi:RimJ/RimL family protein N-acetyltransferase